MRAKMTRLTRRCRHEVPRFRRRTWSLLLVYHQNQPLLLPFCRHARSDAESRQWRHHAKQHRTNKPPPPAAAVVADAIIRRRSTIDATVKRLHDGVIFAVASQWLVSQIRLCCSSVTASPTAQYKHGTHRPTGTIQWIATIEPRE